MKERNVVYTLKPYEEPGMFDQSDKEWQKMNETHKGVLIEISSASQSDAAGHSVVVSMAHIVDSEKDQIVSVPLKNVKLI
ncbi:MAG: hypothetical protein MJZ79_00570 [Paludibacteraceae bacterium]|nr:hypothetical protein [Candidatus Colicola equi]MCQ2339266.1 hypothetical protein [Paludibacteraceae bacterium]